ncbi:MAG TPA: twin-arginine translocation signal domain-containing protein [Bradyrhizobium sp.]|uniref:twin-arginine translocation signal domain-containing protein n=1 Tax=Bradyrhizobium sp. TaxID=376 RepID=UPI002BBCCB30|nr:twin-arginine translocation signal domain-containing protein [Bradyrhizobium sp.]HTB04446.1 twin-arginine translocation signal domain-containing protein [Bradyrhizobium sp.]
MAHLNAEFSGHSSRRIQTLSASLATDEQGDVMERRDFLKLAIGIAAGSAALATSVKAAPLAPQSIAGDQLPAAPEQPELRPAVTSADEVSRLQPEQVRWGHHWHHHWHRRWHRRHWGWHHRHWHRRWHRHHW